MINKNELPKNWEVAKLGEVCEKINKTNKQSQNPNKKFFYLDIGGVDNKTNRILSHKEYFWKDAPSRAQQIVKKNDVLFSTVRTYLKNIARIDDEKYTNQIASTGFTVIRANQSVNSKFIFYYSISNLFLQPLNELQTGSSYPAVRDKDVFSQPFPLPPLAEQERIVAKIEELFSELDAGIESLKTAQAQLKTYRQAVLKYAFEGKLTNENVKEGELPKGWKWVKIDFFLTDKKNGMRTGPFGTMLKKSEHQKEGIAVLGIENIGEGSFQMPNKIFITEKKAQELKSFQVNSNDIIISRSGTVGEICLVPDSMKNSIISTNLIKVSINQNLINSKFFVYMFQGGLVRQQVFDLCKGSSRAFLNQTILNALDFPFCPLDEQQRIVEEIESRLSVCDKLEETIAASLKQSEALRQSILKKAFEGKLVHQTSV